MCSYTVVAKPFVACLCKFHKPFLPFLSRKFKSSLFYLNNRFSNFSFCLMTYSMDAVFHFPPVWWRTWMLPGNEMFPQMIWNQLAVDWFLFSRPWLCAVNLFSCIGIFRKFERSLFRSFCIFSYNSWILIRILSCIFFFNWILFSSSPHYYCHVTCR